MPLCDRTDFLPPCYGTPIPLKSPVTFSEHILCQMFDSFKFLFLISFLKIEYNKWPNFAV
jgi:hypothetical protein